MTALNRKLREVGIVFENEDWVDYGLCQSLIALEKDYVVVLRTCNVLDAELVVYDARTLEPIGGQDFRPGTSIWDDNNRWHSYTFSN